MKCIKISNCYCCPYIDKKNKTCTVNEDADVSVYTIKYPIFCTLDDYPGYKKIEQQIEKKKEKLKIYWKNKKKEKKQKYYNACIGTEGYSKNV